MKTLFLAGSSAATVFALAPLATATRNAGHQTFMASPEFMVPYIAAAGLPPVAITPLTSFEYMFTDRDGNTVPLPTTPLEERMFSGRGFGRMAADTLAPLLALARDWRPDVVVGGSLAYAAGLLARHLGVPYVRHAWDPSETTDMDAGGVEVMRPELGALGLDGLPEPDLYVDICPPSLRPVGAPPAQLMRWVPGNQQRRLEPWMYTRGERLRICVTAGSRAAGGPVRERDVAFLRDLADSLAPLDAEVIVAAPDGITDDLRVALPDARVGWIPLDVLAPTCDLIVHHGGGVTCMTALDAGVPQLVIPQLSHSVAPALRMSDFGASITVMPADANPERCAAASRDLVSDPSYRARARQLSAEIAAQAPPAEVVAVLEKLAG